MTLAERRVELRDRLNNARAAHAYHKQTAAQLGSQMDQLVGAISILDQLIAEDGTSQETDLATPRGDARGGD